MKNAVIFDIDGTIADTSHRIHFLQSKPKDWKNFFGNQHLDPFYASAWEEMDRWDDHASVMITARPENGREVTAKWLEDVHFSHEVLLMRPLKDNRKDFIVKEELLDKLIEMGYTPTVAYDDKDEVLEMYARRGLRIFKAENGIFTEVIKS